MTKTEAKQNLEAAEQAAELAANLKLINLKEAVLDATRREGYDHVESPVQHLMRHLRTYKYSSRESDVLTEVIRHLGWLLNHRNNEIHALRLMIGEMCPSDVANSVNATWICPPSRSVTAGAAPR